MNFNEPLQLNLGGETTTFNLDDGTRNTIVIFENGLTPYAQNVSEAVR